jgi:hypothetical protein
MSEEFNPYGKEELSNLISETFCSLILRLFSIQGSKEDVKKLMEEFHKEIMECVEEYYE